LEPEGSFTSSTCVIRFASERAIAASLPMNRWAAEYLLDCRLQSAAANEFVKTTVIRAKIFNALEDASLCVKKARFAIDHVFDRHLGQLAYLIRESHQLGGLRGGEEARGDNPSFKCVLLDRCAVEFRATSPHVA
jgi:hypothetical protein